MALNNLIQCSGKTVNLSSLACNGDANCIGIKGGYSIPACTADQTAAQNLLSNINRYLLEEEAMQAKFKDNLDTVTGSPGQTARICY